MAAPQPHLFTAIANALTGPTFTAEGPQYAAQAYAQNRPFARPGPYRTNLPPPLEHAFRQWVAAKSVPFDPNQANPDYDMRGYYQQTGGQNWQPGSHFPDTYKTPYDTTFSAESKYATPNNPFRWQGDNLVDARTGRVVFGAPSGIAAIVAALTAATRGGR